MQKITILTHRGLEPSNSEFWPESSFEAFQSHIERGFSIEFDPNFCKDEIVVSHDSTLKRITEGKDERNFSELSINELKFITYGKEKQGRIPSLSEIFDLIRESKASSHALHLKGKYQEKEKIDLLLNVLAMYADTLNKLILFDIKPETAKYIK
ncbi:MAG: glycerophosphodiester phosphodiesterase family protein, partial [Nanoarchaeota archaeon]